jgi:phosphotransferase system HPr (HPr) family protein
MAKKDSVISESQCTVAVPVQPWLGERIANRIAHVAQRFQSEILLSAGILQVNAKSPLLALLVLGVLKGQSLVLTARGKDSAQAVRTLSHIFESKSVEANEDPTDDAGSSENDSSSEEQSALA